MIKINIIGAKEVEQAVKAFEPKMQKRIARRTARRAARPILDEVKSVVPVISGTLRQAYKIRALKRSRKNLGVGVRVVTGGDFFRGDAFYGGFLELGTIHIDARNFLINAMERKRQAVLDTWTTELTNVVNEEKGKKLKFKGIAT